jgi:hypothetical protein
MGHAITHKGKIYHGDTEITEEFPRASAYAKATADDVQNLTRRSFSEAGSRAIFLLRDLRVSVVNLFLLATPTLGKLRRRRSSLRQPNSKML